MDSGVLGLAAVLVGMRMSMLHGTMGVRMHMEVTATPAEQEPDRERHNEHPNGRLGSALDYLWQISAEENHGQAEGEQRGRMSQAPGEA
jgi:hypothetical protein